MDGLKWRKPDTRCHSIGTFFRDTFPHKSVLRLRLEDVSWEALGRRLLQDPEASKNAEFRFRCSFSKHLANITILFPGSDLFSHMASLIKR